jgi:hypothetical protein
MTGCRWTIAYSKGWIRRKEEEKEEIEKSMMRD